MHPQRVILIVAVMLGVGYGWLRSGIPDFGLGALAAAGRVAPEPAAPQGPALQGNQKATFASGCFWCTEADFDKVNGVISTTSGYTAGRVPNPTYEQVSKGGTGHAEAVEVVFDPKVVTYEQLLDHFWRNVDPFVAHRQFCDVGDQYRPAIFVHDAAQRAAAEASKARMQQQFSQRIVVEIGNAGPFYRAEDYHQDYYKKNPVRYNYYRWSCGRDQRLEQIEKARTDD